MDALRGELHNTKGIVATLQADMAIKQPIRNPESFFGQQILQAVKAYAYDEIQLSLTNMIRCEQIQ